MTVGGSDNRSGEPADQSSVPIAPSSRSGAASGAGTAAAGSGNARETGLFGLSRQAILFLIATFFFWASLYVYVPVLSVYAKSLGASLALAGLVISAYGLTQLFARTPVGFASDLLGRRKPFVVAGMIAAGLACFGLAISPGPWALVGSRAIMGLAASMWVTFSVMFASYFPLNRTAMAMSIISFVSGAAQAISGLAGGFLSQQYGPILTFYVGIGLAFLGLAAILPVREVPHVRPTQMSISRLVVIAGTPALVVAAGIATINTLVNFVTTLTFTPIYARGLGATDSQLGLIYTAAIVATTVSSLLGAATADRLGDRGVIAVGMGLAAVATALVPFTHGLVLLAAAQAAAGFGLGWCNPTLMSLSIRSLPAHERASGMGIYQAVYSIGMFAGPPLAGMIADLFGLPSVFYATALLSVGSAVWGLRASALRQDAR